MRRSYRSRWAGARTGADVGWSHRAYSSFQHINDTDPSNPRDYHLALPDRTRDNHVVAALAGVEWAVGDHWSLSVLPRYEQLLGRRSVKNRRSVDHLREGIDPVRNA